jgi:type 1 glutamine amidotransferase
MNKRLRLLSVAVLGLWCLSLAVGTLQAESPEKLRDLKDGEIRNIERALPSKTTVEARPRKMLVFWRCEGFFHGSIPVVNKALELMGKKTGAYDVVITDDYSVFTKRNLRQFDAVCLNNTTGLKFDPKKTPDRCEALMDFVRSGKAIVGVHAATDNFNSWPDGQEMMGGKFTGHPWTSGGTWAFKIDDPDHPLMAAFNGKGFKISDEIYRTDAPLYSRSKQRVLMSLDMSDPTTAGARGVKPSDADTGITWIKTWGKGRVFYCSLGHNDHIFWNPTILQHYLDGIQFAFGDYKVDTTPKPLASSGKGSDMEPKLQELLNKIKAYDWGQSRLALTELSEIIKKAHGDKAELAKIEKALLGVLESDAKQAGKQYVCRELSIIGTEQSVEVLGGMLADQKTSDMARYALERIPGSAVDDALRGAMRKARGKAKVGIINSLGQRRDAKSVRMLSRVLSEYTPGTPGGWIDAIAAAAALGRIATPQAAKTLAAAKDKTEGKVRLAVLDAYLKCADKMVASGKKSDALAIYKALGTASMPKPIRTAAVTGMINAAKN